MSIRARLLLLVSSVLLPAVAAALWLIAQTYQAERAASERNLIDLTRALARVVDGELNQRAAVVRILSQSRLLDDGPALAPEQLALFKQLASDALKGYAGWIELGSGQRTLLDTRGPGGGAAPALKAALAVVPTVAPLAGPGSGAPMVARVVQPVVREGRVVLDLSIVLLPQELQTIVDGQRLPPGWVSTVMDDRGTVVARRPGGPQFVGRLATGDLRQDMATRGEGLFESVSLDGEPVTGYFSRSSQGWVSLVAMPRGASIGRLPDAVTQVVLGTLGLLALAVLGTFWHAQRISAPLQALVGDVERMQRGEAVAARRTGIDEFDRVGRALDKAAAVIRDSESRLARQVSEAVERTRTAEQRVSQSQRVEALGRLTGGVAHDFNNLLGVISNSAYLLRRVCPDPQQAAPIAATLRAVDAGSRLVQQLQRFAGHRPLHPQPTQLAAYLPEILELLKAVLGKRIAISVDVAPGTRPVQVDPSELELALVNLALNARDAMRSGGTLWLQARNAEPAELPEPGSGEGVLLSVTDDGEGLDEDAAARVFEPFFTTKAVGQGTGLGLSQVHGFCVQAGGTARFASTPGLGTTVTLVLPAAPREAMPSAAHAVPSATGLSRLAGLRILLVEDNEELGNLTAELLGADGMTVLRARSGREALEVIDAGQRVDVVLSDIVMPGELDGIALGRTLRERWPALPIVLISGYSAAIDDAQGFTVLRKPCTPALMLETLERAVGPVEASGRG